MVRPANHCYSVSAVWSFTESFDPRKLAAVGKWKHRLSNRSHVVTPLPKMFCVIAAHRARSERERARACLLQTPREGAFSSGDVAMRAMVLVEPRRPLEQREIPDPR